MLFWGIVAAAIVGWIALNAVLAIGIGRAVRIAESKRADETLTHARTAAALNTPVAPRGRTPISLVN